MSHIRDYVKNKLYLITYICGFFSFSFIAGTLRPTTGTKRRLDGDDGGLLPQELKVSSVLPFPRAALQWLKEQWQKRPASIPFSLNFPNFLFFIKICQFICLRLMAQDESQDFLEPVPPSVPNYYYVIREPMDFSKIRKRLYLTEANSQGKNNGTSSLVHQC